MSLSDLFALRKARQFLKGIGGFGRVWLICLGLGLGTAFAAELTGATPEAGVYSDPLIDDQLPLSHWRVLDPGYLVDHLPFKLTVGQTISYNDNVANLPANVPFVVNAGGVSRLGSRGDFYSDTRISLASQFPYGSQNFFLNGSYNPRRYFTDNALDADNYALSGGVNYDIADRCSGQLVGGVTKYQASLDETAGLGVNDVMSTSFNGTARCNVTGHIFGLFNAGVSSQTNSGSSLVSSVSFPFSLNDYTQYYVSGGVEYDLSGLDTFRAITTFTQRNFTNRPLISALASETQQDDYQFSYSRVFSSKLDFVASGGVTLFTLPNTGGKTEAEPIYSFQINYHPTPKITASFSESKSVGAPQAIISDVQSSESQNLSLSYRVSPKIGLSGSLSHATTSNPALASANSTLSNGALPIIFANSESKSASVNLTYTATPLITATAGYSYSHRTDTSRVGFNAVSNVFQVGLVYSR